jgi:hypothetical protein
MASRQVELSVNATSVKLDYFVLGFIDHVVGGILKGLEDTGEIKDLDLSLQGDKVTINLNNAIVPLNAFANKIVRNTIKGMVSALKGVKEINILKISIKH